jgi:uncharacterized membrane protein
MGLSASDAVIVYSLRSIALVAALVASAMSILLIAKVSIWSSISIIHALFDVWRFPHSICATSAGRLISLKLWVFYGWFQFTL